MWLTFTKVLLCYDLESDHDHPDGMSFVITTSILKQSALQEQENTCLKTDGEQASYRSCYIDMKLTNKYEY